MTHEEKQLLIIDLCARLPYGVMVEITSDGGMVEASYNMRLDAGLLADLLHSEDDFMPYLRPMSSMTYEEKQYIRNRWCWEWEEGESIAELFNHYQIDFSDIESFVDWLNENMFDYRGLIPMGFALEAPEGMYKFE